MEGRKAKLMIAIVRLIIRFSVAVVLRQAACRFSVSSSSGLLLSAQAQSSALKELKHGDENSPEFFQKFSDINT